MSNPPIYLTNFMDQHILDLIKIYIQERGSKGLGVLFLEGNTEKSNVNVFYIEKHNCNKDLNIAMDTINCNSKAHFVLLEKCQPVKQYIMIHELDPNQNTCFIEEINEKEGVPDLVD